MVVMSIVANLSNCFVISFREGVKSDTGYFIFSLFVKTVETSLKKK